MTLSSSTKIAITGTTPAADSAAAATSTASTTSAAIINEASNTAVNNLAAILKATATSAATPRSDSTTAATNVADNFLIYESIKQSKFGQKPLSFGHFACIVAAILIIIMNIFHKIVFLLTSSGLLTEMYISTQKNIILLHLKGKKQSLV